MLDFAQVRRAMIDSQLRTFDISSRALLAAMNDLPRERFVAPGLEEVAYMDGGVAVGPANAGERLMLAPAALGRLIQALDVKPGESALDIACGHGYAAALFARLGAEVTAVESDECLAEGARRILESLGIMGVTVAVAPLASGPESDRLFDVVLINGAIGARPQKLLDRLAPGGRLACIEGIGRSARAVIYLRSGDAFGRRELFDAAAQSLPEFAEAPGFVF